MDLTQESRLASEQLEPELLRVRVAVLALLLSLERCPDAEVPLTVFGELGIRVTQRLQSLVLAKQ